MTPSESSTTTRAPNSFCGGPRNSGGRWSASRTTGRRCSATRRLVDDVRRGVGETTTELRRERLTARMLEPGGSGVVITEIEVRFDPLTGHSSRILPDRGLMPPSDFDLEAFARQNQPRCPFCPERIETQTPQAARRPPSRRQDQARRGGPVPESARLLVAQLRVDLFGAAALPAARATDRAAADGQPGHPGRVCARGDGE